MAEHIPGLAILASNTEGSTTDWLIRATQIGLLAAEVGLVIVNSSKAGIIPKVERLNKQYGLDIEVRHISGKTHPNGAKEPGQQTDQEAYAICRAISAGKYALAVCTGYPKEIRGELLQEYGAFATTPNRGRLLNTHPGPLPQTKGLQLYEAQERVIDLELDYTAQILHKVSGGYDGGPIIAEHRIPVLDSDDAESLCSAVQATEKAHLPDDIGKYMAENA